MEHPPPLRDCGIAISCSCVDFSAYISAAYHCDDDLGNDGGSGANIVGGDDAGGCGGGRVNGGNHCGYCNEYVFGDDDVDYNDDSGGGEDNGCGDDFDNSGNSVDDYGDSGGRVGVNVDEVLE